MDAACVPVAPPTGAAAGLLVLLLLDLRAAVSLVPALAAGTATVEPKAPVLTDAAGDVA